jgi:hypothetical protein
MLGFVIIIMVILLILLMYPKCEQFTQNMDPVKQREILAKSSDTQASRVVKYNVNSIRAAQLS